MREVASMQMLRGLRTRGASESGAPAHVGTLEKAGWRWNWGSSDRSRNQVPKMPGYVWGVCFFLYTVIRYRPRPVTPPGHLQSSVSSSKKKSLPTKN